MEINNIPEALTLPLRLTLISSLIEGEKSFNELKEITNASDGNISIQLKKLEGWGYLKSEKRLEITKYKTFYKITSFGRNQLEDYVDLLERIIKSK